MLKKLFLIPLIFMSAAMLFSCDNALHETPAVTINQNNIPASDAAENTRNDIETEIQAPDILPEPVPEAPSFVNPLTGMETQKDLTNVRPIAVMINNLKQALPQIGISEADIVYETLEEGGITRLLCIYNDYADIPEIGSVRSARDYYIDIADAHDAIFVHSGASTYAYTSLSQRKTNNLDGIYLPQFYRSAERRKTMRKEHTLMISGSGIAQAIENKGYRTTSDAQNPLCFSQEYSLGEAKANHIEFPFSIGYTSKPYVTCFFDYNQQTGTYQKGQFRAAHIDGDDNQQLDFKNVIVLSCPMNRIEDDPLGCIQVHFVGQGKGSYGVDGTYREIVWKKPSRSSAYTLYESDGKTPLVISPGKSYVAIVPSNTKITIS